MEHWEILSSGLIKTPETAEQLWKAAVGYFRWCKDNPLQSDSMIRTGKDAGDVITVTKKRPFTVSGLCIHCGITEQYLKDICSIPEAGNGWYIVGERISMIIKTQILENALQNEFSAVISSKILALDNKEDNMSNKPIKVEVVNSDMIGYGSEDEAVAAIEREGKGEEDVKRLKAV